MKKEVFELLKKLDIQAVETQMALRCAPLIAGLKTSNLLIVGEKQIVRVQQLLDHTRFSSCLLYQGAQKAVLLLYTERQLKCCLEKPEARKILRQQGYQDFSFQALLLGFAARYEAYMQDRKAFPHEMGLFLGYPPEDVSGFVKNNGKNALYAGYWKVYQDKEAKMCLFESFDRAKECLIRLTAEGVRMEEVLEQFANHWFFLEKVLTAVTQDSKIIFE